MEENCQIIGNNEIETFLKEIAAEKKDLASRKSSQVFLEYAVKKLPEILGGSADLTPSNLTFTSSSKSIINGTGNYIHYGVREFGMSAIIEWNNFIRIEYSIWRNISCVLRLF